MPSATPASAAVGADGGAPARPVVLGLDIGGTKIAAGVVDGTGAAHAFVLEPTYAARGPEEGLERLFALGRSAIEASGLDVDAVGIGCGGPLDDEQGILVSPPHLPGWEGLELAARAEAEFDRPAVLENDATAAAAGEHRFGAGVGTRNLVYLTVSTGVGGGAVVDGRLLRGSRGNGAELGHVTVACDGRPCPGCGRSGCLEAYVSGTSIAARAREGLTASDGTSVLASSPDLTAAEVAAAARAGDRLATAIWDETTAMLACGVVSIVNVFEPEIVVVGGGVSAAGEQLLAPVREHVRAEAMTPAGRETRVLRAALDGHVGVVGAAAIAVERLAANGRLLRR